MNYLYQKIEDAIQEVKGESIRRQAVRGYMRKMAAVLRAVEWNDSGDGDDEEDNLIDDLIGAPVMFDIAKKALRESVREVEELFVKLDTGS